MSLYVLKIRNKYLSSIREGKKRHEYRLATPERRNISVGDILVLVDNQDKENFVKVVVEKKEIYRTWDDALSKYWRTDFPDYHSIEDIKKDCYKFYSKQDVDINGIEVLLFSLFKVDINQSNILLDTNIVIHRESSNNVAYEVMQLYKLIDKLKINKFLHEDIKQELSKYKDQKVKEAMLSKLEAYNILPSLPVRDQSFINIVSKYGKNDNSDIDNKFLYQIFKGKVDYFVTEDKTLLQKAKDLYLDDVVLTCSGFLKFIENLYPSMINYPVLSVKLTKIGTLDINDDFFDSLREDYGGIKFNKWFISKSGEDAYVFHNFDGLQGFLYLKIENENENFTTASEIEKSEEEKLNDSTYINFMNDFFKNKPEWSEDEDEKEIYFIQNSKGNQM